jgi:uncharacterized protein
MDTPWGNIAVRDAHVHFFSHGFFAALGALKGGLAAAEVAHAAGWEAPPEDPALLADRWVQDLDRHGVTSAVLISSLPGDEGSVQAAVKRHPTRLSGYFFVNPLLPDAAQRATAGLAGGLRGICLFPAMHGYSLHDERCLAVIGAAAAHPGALVFVHCGVLTVGIRKKIGLPSRFDLRYSNPVDLHAIALRYPDLPFVIPHFGAGYFREALMVADLCPNVHLDTSSSNSWVKYQPEGIRLRQVFEHALAVLGAGRLLFGTDSTYFPKGWNSAVFHEQVDALHGLGVDRDEAALIFGGNLRRLLGLPENLG